MKGNKETTVIPKELNAETESSYSQAPNPQSYPRGDDYLSSQHHQAQGYDNNSWKAHHSELYAELDAEDDFVEEEKGTDPETFSSSTKPATIWSVPNMDSQGSGSAGLDTGYSHMYPNPQWHLGEAYSPSQYPKTQSNVNTDLEDYYAELDAKEEEKRAAYFSKEDTGKEASSSALGGYDNTHYPFQATQEQSNYTNGFEDPSAELGTVVKQDMGTNNSYFQAPYPQYQMQISNSNTGFEDPYPSAHYSELDVGDELGASWGTGYSQTYTEVESSTSTRKPQSMKIESGDKKSKKGSKRKLDLENDEILNTLVDYFTNKDSEPLVNSRIKKRKIMNKYNISKEEIDNELHNALNNLKYKGVLTSENRVRKRELSNNRRK